MLISRTRKKLLNNKGFRNFGTYSFYSIIEKSIPFFILPIYTRLLSAEDTGFYILFLAIYSVVLPLSKIGLDSLALVNYYKLDNNKFKDFLSKSLVLYLIWFVIFFCICIFLAPFIGSALELNSHIILAIVLVVFPYYFISLRLNIYRASKQALNYSKLIIAVTLLKHLSALLLLLLLKANWLYIICAYGVSHFIMGAFSLRSLWSNNLFSRSFNFVDAKKIIKDGYPLALHQINTWFGSAYSRVAIADNLGIISTGGFGIASTFQAVISLIHESFDKAYVPQLFESIAKTDKRIKIKIVKYSYAYYCFLVISGILISLVGYYGLDIIYGDNFSDFKIYVPYLVMASVFNGFYKIHVAYIFFEKKMIYITLITFLSSITNITLIHLLIGRLGMLGVALALIFAQLIAYVAAFYFGNKFYKMPWSKF